MKKFALIGAAGYIAPRHMKAIQETGNNLTAALDNFDSVGVMDRYFPKADFFTEFERFDRHLDKQKQKGENLDYISVCSPNYLHDAHIRFGLKHGADVISEKPLVLNPWNADALQQIEKETGRKVYNLLQLRYHESIIALREKIAKAPKDKIFDVDLTYLTSRGNWYYTSWKGNVEKSGGIATNIGVHFFDMLSWIFGDVKENIVHIKTEDVNAGMLKLKNANVKWFLSVNYEYIPQEIKDKGQTTFRSIMVEGEEIEFSGGFKDLHTRSYEEILNGNGFGLDDAYSSVNIISQIRKIESVKLLDDYHPFCDKVK